MLMLNVSEVILNQKVKSLVNAYQFLFPINYSYLTVTFITETMATANALLRTEVYKKVVSSLVSGRLGSNFT